MASRPTVLDALFGPAVIRKDGVDFPQRSVIDLDGAVEVDDDPVTKATKLTFSGGGEENTASNVGGGVELAKAKDGINLPFRTLVSGGYFSITQNADTVELGLAGTIPVSLGGTGRTTVGGANTVCFSDGANLVFGTVTNDMVAAGAAIAVSKLASGSNYQGIVMSGGTPAWGAVVQGISLFGGAAHVPIDVVNGSIRFRSLRGTSPIRVTQGATENTIDLDSPIPYTLLSADPSINGLRLSLVSGEPVPSSDTPSSNIVYLTPYVSGAIALYDGTRWLLRTTEEISITLSGLTSGKNYDVFAYWTGSTVAIELSAAWTTDAVRSTSITTQNGVIVKTSDMSRRYIGTIRTTSTTTTSDNPNRRYVYNAHNRVERALAVNDSADNWSYTTTNTWRQANASTSNAVLVVAGMPTSIKLRGLQLGYATVAGAGITCGIGIDSTATNSAKLFGAVSPVAGADGLVASWCEYSATISGYHALNWLERTTAASTTMVGTRTYGQAGLVGTILA